ncbi:MAG: cytochrome P450 [Deltaproteobacteria bacterium]|nr:MAG: cytochrome P450 [Deltaproteobacteria bacterium]TMB44495.1 MAG: cytochrome P450 [Deltaproteobacteria bacterium]
MEDRDETYDPFEALDRAAGAGAVRDPYPTFATLRGECPVHHGRLSAAFGLPEAFEAVIVPTDRHFVAMSHEAAVQVLRDGETFSSRGYAGSIGLVLGHSILEMDDPEHARYRELIQQAFTLQAMERWEARLVRPIVHGLVDRFVNRGRADLVRELTFPFPIHVIAGMLGLPEADLPRFHRWAVELINIAGDIQRGLAASQTLRDYFAGVLAARRRDPQEDMISVLAHAELDGQRLTDEEIFAFLRLLLPAGAETTYRSSSNLFCGLLTHPDQLEAVRADRSLVRRAIDEGLRWEPPLTGIARIATRDVEVAGVEIPKGAVVSVCLGAANHDPARYPAPETFDIRREQRPHLAFAYGPHTCVGMHLARMETRVVLEAVLDRLPNLRLDPEAPDVHITGLSFRAPRRLPVLFG